jgi:hypothetical protein
MLFIASFAFDVVCHLMEWNRSLVIWHGIAFHMCTFVCIGSMIAAMRSMADDKVTFTYRFLLSHSLAKYLPKMVHFLLNLDLRIPKLRLKEDLYIHGIHIVDCIEFSGNDFRQGFVYCLPTD